MLANVARLLFFEIICGKVYLHYIIALYYLHCSEGFQEIKFLSKYINQFNILFPSLSGFRPNFPTTMALMKFTNDLCTSFDKCRLTGAIFIDLSKEFDMVDHYLLLDKLHSIGFDQNSLF